MNTVSNLLVHKNREFIDQLATVSFLSILLHCVFPSGITDCKHGSYNTKYTEMQVKVVKHCQSLNSFSDCTSHNEGTVPQPFRLPEGME
jgi:hypothetical protein